MTLTNLEALKSVNAYPIPPRTLMETAARRGVMPEDEATQESLHGKEFRLAKADLLLWLSTAPNITQGGQSFSFTDEQRKDFRRQAYAAYAALEARQEAVCATFGYKGDRL